MSVSSLSNSDEDSLLDFQYIPKAERDRQRAKSEAIDSHDVSRDRGSTAPACGERLTAHSAAGRYSTTTTPVFRKRARTVYEQERDAKVEAVLARTGAASLLEQAHQLETQEVHLHVDQHISSEHVYGNDEHQHQDLYDAQTSFGGQPRQGQRVRHDHNVSVAEWKQQTLERQYRRTSMLMPHNYNQADRYVRGGGGFYSGGQGRGGAGSGYPMRGDMSRQVPHHSFGSTPRQPFSHMDRGMRRGVRGGGYFRGGDRGGEGPQ